MKVRYGYPRDGHQPDEIVDLDPAEARRVIRNGFGQAVTHEHDDEPTSNRAICPVCDREFKTEAGRDRHVEKEHPDQPATTGEPEGAS